LQLFPFSHATFRATSIKYFAKCKSLILKTCFRNISLVIVLLAHSQSLVDVMK